MTTSRGCHRGIVFGRVPVAKKVRTRWIQDGRLHKDGTPHEYVAFYDEWRTQWGPHCVHPGCDHYRGVDDYFEKSGEMR